MRVESPEKVPLKNGKVTARGKPAMPVSVSVSSEHAEIERRREPADSLNEERGQDETGQRPLQRRSAETRFCCGCSFGS